jgi:outer membrane protein assembly factor BamB
MKLKLITLIAFTIISSGFAQEVQWRGPDRNGIYPDKGLLQQWPEEGPGLILMKEGLGGGYSTPVLYEGKYFVSGRRDSIEVMTALASDGTILWETTYGRAWMESFQETRNTPAIENNRIYIQGAMGTTACIDAISGDIIWSVNPHEAYDAKFHRWGMAESVILTSEYVITSPVGDETVMVALNKADGSLAWKSKGTGDQRSYVSPLMIEHKGRRMLLATTSQHLVSIDPADGSIIWTFDLVADFTDKGRRISTNTPLYHDGEIFVTSGYNDQALMLKLSPDGTSVSVKWTSDVLDNHHGGLVLVDGYIYGSNWINNGNGNWVCLDWDTGEVMYETEWNNKGSIIYADNRLYVLTEKRGFVGLIEATPEAFNVISSFQLEQGRGPYWAHPSIFDKKLLLRHTDKLFVYDVSL